MSQLKNAYPGQIRKGDNGLYYKQSGLCAIEVFVGEDSIQVPENKVMYVNKLEEDQKVDNAKFADYEVVAAIKLGEEMGKANYKKIRAFNIVSKKDNSGKYLKVACDRIIAFRNGEKILFEKGDILNLETKQDRLEKAAYLLENEYIDEERYEELVEKAERMPDYAVANVVGKGKVL